MKKKQVVSVFDLLDSYLTPIFKTGRDMRSGFYYWIDFQGRLNSLYLYDYAAGFPRFSVNLSAHSSLSRSLRKALWGGNEPLHTGGNLKSLELTVADDELVDYVRWLARWAVGLSAMVDVENPPYPINRSNHCAGSKISEHSYLWSVKGHASYTELHEKKQ